MRLSLFLIFLCGLFCGGWPPTVRSLAQTSGGSLTLCRSLAAKAGRQSNWNGPLADRIFKEAAEALRDLDRSLPGVAARTNSRLRTDLQVRLAAAALESRILKLIHSSTTILESNGGQEPDDATIAYLVAQALRMSSNEILFLLEVMPTLTAVLELELTEPGIEGSAGARRVDEVVSRLSDKVRSAMNQAQGILTSHQTRYAWMRQSLLDSGLGLSERDFPFLEQVVTLAESVRIASLTGRGFEECAVSVGGSLRESHLKSFKDFSDTTSATDRLDRMARYLADLSQRLPVTEAEVAWTRENFADLDAKLKTKLSLDDPRWRLVIPFVVREAHRMAFAYGSDSGSRQQAFELVLKRMGTSSSKTSLLRDILNSEPFDGVPQTELQVKIWHRLADEVSVVTKRATDPILEVFRASRRTLAPHEIAILDQVLSPLVSRVYRRLQFQFQGEAVGDEKTAKIAAEKERIITSIQQDVLKAVRIFGLKGPAKLDDESISELLDWATQSTVERPKWNVAWAPYPLQDREFVVDWRSPIYQMGIEFKESSEQVETLPLRMIPPRWYRIQTKPAEEPPARKALLEKREEPAAVAVSKAPREDVEPRVKRAKREPKLAPQTSNIETASRSLASLIPSEIEPDAAHVLGVARQHLESLSLQDSKAMISALSRSEFRAADLSGIYREYLIDFLGVFGLSLTEKGDIRSR